VGTERLEPASLTVLRGLGAALRPKEGTVAQAQAVARALVAAVEALSDTQQCLSD